MFDKAYFDAGLYRMGTRSIKWDGCRAEHGAEALPMWVADMDFQSPPAVQQALLARAAHPTYGYTEIKADDYEALTNFWQRRHGLEIKPEQVVMLPCVITGMRVVIEAVTEPGDGVIIATPVYGPFYQSIEATGRKIVDCPMTHDGLGRYSMDLDAIEAALKNGAKAMMLCNPHNPVSRLWTREELEKLVALLDRYGAYLISDEIHADFVYKPGVFTPALSVSQKRVVSMCAASKTFNLAGLLQASCFCPDDEIRTKIQAVIEKTGVRSGNIFALEGTRAAYNEGDEWLDVLMAYLDSSRHLLRELVEKELPGAVLSPIEATYLGWLDLSKWGYEKDELKERMEKAGVIFTMGAAFGEAGNCFVRFNFGCPQENIRRAVLQVREALK